MSIVDKLISIVNRENVEDEKNNMLINNLQSDTGEKRNLLISEPKMFEEAKQLADFIKMQRPLIVNTSKMDKEGARRLLDFLSGALYSFEGESQRISDGIFIFTPKSYLASEKIEA